MQISIVKKTSQCLLLIVLLHMIHFVTYVTLNINFRYSMVGKGNKTILNCCIINRGSVSKSLNGIGS